MAIHDDNRRRAGTADTVYPRLRSGIDALATREAKGQHFELDVEGPVWRASRGDRRLRPDRPVDAGLGPAPGCPHFRVGALPDRSRLRLHLPGDSLPPAHAR